MVRLPLERATQQAAEYTPAGTRAEHCGVCLHFISPTRCERIQGTVRSDGWCKYFRRIRSAR